MCKKTRLKLKACSASNKCPCLKERCVNSLNDADVRPGLVSVIVRFSGMMSIMMQLKPLLVKRKSVPASNINSNDNLRQPLPPLQVRTTLLMTDPSTGNLLQLEHLPTLISTSNGCGLPQSKPKPAAEKKEGKTRNTLT